MSAIYLVGAPATGKSSAMRLMISMLGLATGEWFKIWPTTHAEFRGELLEDIVTGDVRGLSLGVTRGAYSGTDAIGMASHSEAMAWVAEAETLPDLILGEGQRLGTPKFLLALAARVELTVGYLTADLGVLDERCAARGSTQSSMFRKGTATRARKAADAARDAGIHVVEIDTSLHDPSYTAYTLLTSAGVGPWGRVPS